MEWKYVKPLQTERLITSFENLVKYKFPEEFRKTVLLYNGGVKQIIADMPCCCAFRGENRR